MKVKNSVSSENVDASSMQLVGLFWHKHAKIYATFPEKYTIFDLRSDETLRIYRPFRLTRAIALALLSTLVKAITRAFHCSGKITILVKSLNNKLVYSFQIKCILIYI